MSARESLILAYQNGHLTPERAGDGDIGAKQNLKQIKRNTKKPNVRATSNNRSTINSSQIIANGLEAGKIISAAEGNKIHTQAYSRLHYSDRSFSEDLGVLYAYVVSRLLKEDSDSLIAIGMCDGMIKSLCRAEAPDPAEAEEYQEIYKRVEKILSSLDRGLVYRVSQMLTRLRVGCT